MSALNGTNGLPKSNANLVGSNYGINLTNPAHYRVYGPVGASERMALQMAVDGTLIVLDVPPVTGGAWGRRVADLGYGSGRVSRQVTAARDVEISFGRSFAQKALA